MTKLLLLLFHHGEGGGGGDNVPCNLPHQLLLFSYIVNDTCPLSLPADYAAQHGS